MVSTKTESNEVTDLRTQNIIPNANNQVTRNKDMIIVFSMIVLTINT